MSNQIPNGRGSIAPEWLRSSVTSLERNAGLDRAASYLAPVAETVGAGPRGDALRGRWLGHALHPLLTDFPLGCWLSAGLLDLLGGRKSRPAARRLIGLGLVFSLPTAAAGLADWSVAKNNDDKVRRLGVVHGVGNMIVALLYFRSWRSRRQGNHLRGLLWGMSGGSLAWGTGWLGGHMAIAYGAAEGERGLSADQPSSLATAGSVTGGSVTGGTAAVAGAGTGGSAPIDDLLDLSQASQHLGVGPEQIRAMVDQGLLTPVNAAGDQFRHSEVEAVRLQGG